MKKFSRESEKMIGFYERRFYCFSNFSSFSVEWRNRLWQTSEHAYQAAKFMDKNPEIVEEIYNSKSAHDSKKIACEKYKDNVCFDWDSKKIQIMEEICLAKLQQHKFIQKRLIQTKNKEIIEDSPKDNFWGWGSDKKGRNELGKIWMRLRDEYLKSNDK
jgi:ribA/ribD-fused uncharacterized protein